jgi:uncharacterized protein YukE
MPWTAEEAKMIGRRAMTVAMMAVGVGLAGGTQLAGQNPAARAQQEQQLLRLQAQAAQLDEAIRQMARIQERAQLLEQEMVRQMSRLQQQEGGQQALMLQNQERLRTMAQALGEGAREVHRAMEQLRLMVGEPGPGWDPEAERELVRLRASWEQTAQRMEEGLTIMERLRDRLSQPDGSQ